ncbi:PadR family transcriptional regulator [Candidatus Thorarchaeota archaeon]|nr:MAG: PadR family transcriptional regulator [Candidatus Thorarchaeota archaeon]
MRGLLDLQKGPSFEDSWKIEIRRGILQYAVLAIVKQYEQGIHGYGIARELEERTDGLLQVKEGTLYPILHRLRKERLLNVYNEKSESGPSKKVYVLTGEGDRVYRHLTVIVGDIFEKLEALKSE